jgi:hypothetical protein
MKMSKKCEVCGNFYNEMFIESCPRCGLGVCDECSVDISDDGEWECYNCVDKIGKAYEDDRG